MAYAEGTTVPVGQSRGQIEAVLEKAGAKQFASGTDRDQGISAIQFSLGDRMYRIAIPIPNLGNPVGAKLKDRYGYKKPAAQIDKALLAEERRLWRCLLMMVKTKVEWVSMGMSTFDREFLPHTFLSDGRTVEEWLVPQLDQAYAEGGMPPLLGVGSCE